MNMDNDDIVTSRGLLARTADGWLSIAAIGLAAYMLLTEAVVIWLTWTPLPDDLNATRFEGSFWERAQDFALRYARGTASFLALVAVVACVAALRRGGVVDRAVLRVACGGFYAVGLLTTVCAIWAFGHTARQHSLSTQGSVNALL